MKGAVKKQQTTTRSEQMPSRNQLLDELFPPAITTPPPPTAVPLVAEATYELPKQNHQQLSRQNTQPPEPIPCLTPDTEVQREALPQKTAEVPSNLPIATGRPRTSTRKPNRYGHNICEGVESETGHW